jgi:hypothetical protein
MSENPLGLRVGSVLRDNDSRNDGRTITVIGISRDQKGHWWASYQGGRRRSRVALDRIFRADDGRPHSQGYTIVTI